MFVVDHIANFAYGYAKRPCAATGIRHHATRPACRNGESVNAVLEVLIYVTLGGWILFEILLLVRDRRHGRGRADADRGTLLVNALFVVETVVVSGVLSATLHVSVVPGAIWFRSVGLVIVWLGLALRVWAITTLGAAFRMTVEVDQSQPVVTNGPYRWVRHPSYTGLLIITAGFGIAFASWLFLALCAVLPSLALLRRIKVEESEMARVLGEPYRTYSAETKRLVPGIW
jgi:protein-S-isoprenylcysteine O-methyltransferase Ste14